MLKSPQFRSTSHLRTQSNLCFLQKCFIIQPKQVDKPFQLYQRKQIKIELRQNKTSLKKKIQFQSKSTQKSEIKLEHIASSPNFRNSNIFNMKKSQNSVFTTLQFNETVKQVKQFKQKTLKKHHFSSNLYQNKFPKQQLFPGHNNFKIIPKQISQNPIIKQKPFQQIQERTQIKIFTKNIKKVENNCLSPQTPNSPQFQIKIHFQAQQQKWNDKYQSSLKLIQSVSSQMINSREKNQLIENKRSKFLQNKHISTMQTLSLSPNEFRDTISVNMQESKNNTSLESFVIGRNMN